MLKSPYYTETKLTPEEELKRKLLKEKPATVAPTTEELDEQIELNTPAYLNVPGAASNKYNAIKDSLITGGNYVKDFAETKVDTDEEDDEDDDGPSTASKLGTGAVKASGQIIDFAATAAQKKGAMDRKERNANTLNLATKGAAMGATIGSVIPGLGTVIGGAAGFVVGGATGLIQGASGKKKYVKEQKLLQANYLSNIKNERMKSQILSDGKNELEKSKNLLQNQIGLISSKYTNS